MIVRSVVVLPAPLRPSSIVTSPEGTSKSTPCRMWYAPMWVCTPREREQRPHAHAGFGFRREAEIGLAHDGRGDHRLRLAVGDELAVVQHDDAVGELAHDVHLVLDQQDGLVALALELADQLEDHRHVGGAHAGGRLVEHVDARLERHQHRDLELALVAVRQAARRGVLAAGQAHPLDQLVGAPARCPGDRATPRTGSSPSLAPRLHREAHVLEHAQAGEELRQLEGAAEAAVRARRRPARR